MAALDGPGCAGWDDDPALSARLSLQTAMLTLAALRVAGLRPYDPSLPSQVGEFYLDPPSPHAVSRMDRVLSWILLIPATRPEIRRAVGLGSMTHPVSGKVLFAERKLGELLGCSGTQAKRLFDKGIDHITVALARPGFCSLMGGRTGPTRDEVLNAVRRMHARPRQRRLERV